MSELLTFRSLQKLRFFLAGVFPFLARTPRWAERPPSWLERYPSISRWWKPLRESSLRANAQRVATTFAIGNYADKQLEWSKIPPESTAILRFVIILGTLLCVLLPLAIKLVWPALSHETITGVAGPPVAGWSIWLWMIAFAVGWSCALIGTAAASRAAFVPTVALFVYFGVVLVAALSKSWWNTLVALEAAAAVLYCESRHARVRRSDIVRGLLSAILGGQAVLFAAVVATPMTPLFRGHLTSSVAFLGAAFGSLLWWLAPRLRRAHETSGVPVRLDHAIMALAGVHLTLLITLVVRGGLVAPAQGIASFAVSITGYLWPLYYFLGIGVMFKVLRQAKTVQRAARELVRPGVFVPFTLAAIAIVLLVAWSERAISWPSLLGAAAAGVYGATSWIWARPLFGFTMEPMKWILLLALIVAIWGMTKRRFNSGVAAGLLFTVVLLWLAVFEYFFEYTGFSRSYQHSALSLLLFATFVLWLTYRTAFDFVGGSSTWWPAPARVAIYASGVLFVLMPLHARAALHDGTLPNEIFLYLFFGVIDLGLPYYLYVYAQRRFASLPLGVPAMLAFFGIGAALSVPLIVLDKAALAQWSTSAMWSRASAQAAALLQGTPLPPAQNFLPVAWILLRGLLAIGAIVVVAALARRLTKDVRLAPAVAIFSAVAVGAGLASFSNRSVDLPLVPLRIMQLITPLNVSLAIDASLVARHLSYFLPAMLVGLVLSAPQAPSGRWPGLSAAFAMHCGLALAWPRGEAWLRSTGALVLLGSAGVVLFLWLTAVLRDRLDGVLEPNAAASTPRDASQLLLAPDVRRACVALLLVLSVAAAFKAHSGRLIERPVATLPVSARVPAVWSAATMSREAAAALVLTARSRTLPRPLLTAVVRSGNADSRALLQVVSSETAQRFSAYRPLKLEQWEQYYPGSLALDFQALMPGDSGVRVLGTTVLAPLPNGQALIATVVHGIGDVQRRWDLARLLQALPRSK